MKLRRIELNNIRRFAGRKAVLDDLPNGVAVVSEPNEFGKSTFFDAVHALFFEAHSSSGKIAKSLQPHSKGTPAVALDVEVQGRLYRLEKRWVSQKMARVTELPSGRIIAQGDEAEAWISGLLHGGEGGPAGLLWVRQGAFSVDPEGAGAAAKRLGDDLRATRRSLVTAVSGELDALTGGRRMEHVERRLDGLLTELVTLRGQAKAGTEWSRLLKEIELLEKQREEVSGKVERLYFHLDARRKAEAELSRLSRPEDRAARAERLQEARIAFEEAKGQSEALARLASEGGLLAIQAKEARREAGELQALVGALRELQLAYAEQQEQILRKEAALGLAQSTAAEAEAGMKAAKLQSEALASRLNRALLLQSAHSEAALRAQKRQQLAAAEGQQKLVLEAQVKRAQILAKPSDEARLNELSARILQIKAKMQAVALHFSGAGLAQILQDGQPLPAAEVSVQGRTVFTLGALGQLEVITAQAAAEDVPSLERQVQEGLAAFGVENLAQLRSQLTEAESLDRTIKAALESLKLFAPQGLAALALEAALKDEAELEAPEDIPALEIALARAKGETESTNAQFERLRRAAEEEASGLRLLRQSYELKGEEIKALEARRGPEEAFAAKLSVFGAEALRLEAEALEKREAHKVLASRVPDLALVESRYARAKEVSLRAEEEITHLERDIHGHSTVIGHEADQGVEEDLGRIEGEIAALTLRSEAYAREAKVLQRAEQAIKAARSSAREAYLTPLLQELKPLLHVMAPDGAEIELDEESLLPVAILRGGQREVVDVLSGGTREQLAVLTRFAFARILARSGEDVPIILDDALVHSDDERISRMFDMLHDLARDRQVLVFTCRQRAFTDLGGQRLRVSYEEA